MSIPNILLKQAWDIKKMIVRGLFDTDGIIFARKDEDYKYPHISITSKNHALLNQIKNQLKLQKYPAYINGKDVRIKGINNTKKWFKDINSSNRRNFERYDYFLKNGNLPPRSTGPWSKG